MGYDDGFFPKFSFNLNNNTASNYGFKFNPSRKVGGTLVDPDSAVTSIASKPGIAAIGKYGLGKAGLMGVPYLGAGLAGAALLSKGFGLFGKRGPNPLDAQRDAYSLSQEGLGNQYAGRLGSLGQEFEAEGLDQMRRGESQYLDALLDPSFATRQQANIASQLGQANAGLVPMMRTMGGGLAGSQFARQLQQRNAPLAMATQQIGQNALQNRANAFNAMRGFGAGKFQQGLGLGQQAYGTQQDVINRRMGYLSGRRQEQMQDRQLAQAPLNALFGAAGTFAGSRGRLG